MRPIDAELIEAIEGYSENRGFCVNMHDNLRALNAIVLDIVDWSRDVQSDMARLTNKVGTLSKTVDALVSRTGKYIELPSQVAALTKKVEELATRTNAHSQKLNGQSKKKNQNGNGNAVIQKMDSLSQKMGKRLDDLSKKVDRLKSPK